MTGAELPAHRKAAGLSQSELAKRVGVSRDTVGYWEAKEVVPTRHGAPFFVLRSARFAGFVTPLRARAGLGSYNARPMASPVGRFGRGADGALAGAKCQTHHQAAGAVRGQDPQEQTMPNLERTGQAKVQVSRGQKHRAEDCRGAGQDCTGATAALGYMEGTVSE